MTADERIIRRARRLRQESNLPEQQAWKVLRTLRQHGFPVRRQHPIGPFVADFAITRARMIIEIDGGVHRLDEVADRDKRRDVYFEREGWRVLRFSATEALNEDYLFGRVTEALGL